jgi:hypothetical protein
MKFGNINRITTNELINSPESVVSAFNELISRLERMFNGNIDLLNNIKCEIKELDVFYQEELFVPYTENINGILLLDINNTSNSINRYIRNAQLNWDKVNGGFTLFFSWSNNLLDQNTANVKILILT